MAAQHRGLPKALADRIYAKAQEIMDREDLDTRGFGQVTTGIARIAASDIETGRYQAGEAGNTVNVTQQTGIQIEQPSEPSRFKQQVASMLASMLPAHWVDAHLLAGNSDPSHGHNDGDRT